MTPDGTLAASVLTRVERCVQLYDVGLAPVILFSGGTAAPDGPSAGGQMMRHAVSRGMSERDALVEGASQSTLQNAIFSMSLVEDAQRYILVTEGFHLPRAWASFHWAAWELGTSDDLSVRLVMSENVRRDPATGAINWTILFRESLAIWFNAGRALAYSVTPDPSMDWLH